MKNTPIDFAAVERKLNETRIGDLGVASIREIKRLIDLIEAESGQRRHRGDADLP